VLRLALVIAAAVLAVYATLVALLVALGRREDARAVAGFVPDCAVLFGRLARDPHVGRGYKLLLGAVVLYLAMPFDLVPDFIPIAGQLDDAVLVGLVLRAVVRGANAQLLAEHWPGPPSSLELVLRLAGAGVSSR
jgi:uncharacterized membrane protein YkvA (DUF1232 family)